MARRKVLIIQGAGEGAHAEDRALADYLASALGPDYDVAYPEFPGLENVDHAAWTPQIAAELAGLGADGVAVAHSLGGAALLKYLAEAPSAPRPAALFLVASPYKGRDGEWGTDEFAMDAAAAAPVAEATPLTLYHSRDDEWVPFTHLAAWAEKLPAARTRAFDDRGHAFTRTAFVELVDDIRRLHP